jgi:DNA helicase-4|tara:strand:- start:270 stop:464 length:195 start_codon:yes stop_codon:yes gene_type:complete
MQECEIPLSTLHDEEIFENLKELGFIDEGASRYLKCLQAIRVECLDSNSILERLQKNGIENADK